MENRRLLRVVLRGVAARARAHGFPTSPSPRRRSGPAAMRRASVVLGAGLFLGQCSPSCAPTLVQDEPSAAAGAVVATTTTLGPAPGAPVTSPSTTLGSPTPTTPSAGTYFGWVGLGGTLPTGAQCADAVRAAPRPEIRAGNATANATTWRADPVYPRADGAFTGSTDDIIRWAACKWGFDEDVLRAQVVRESYWHQRTLGDWTTDASRCAPGHGIGVDGRAGQCPESVGLMQVRGPYLPGSIVGATASSAYNLDVALAVWRSCYDGEETWLNNVERGRTYAAGDAWGCVGRWLAGRWYTAAALTYIGEVQTLLAQRAWTTTIFVNAT
jgi:hypothetical protein